MTPDMDDDVRMRLLAEELKEELRDQVKNELRAEVWAEVWAEEKAKVWDEVWAEEKAKGKAEVRVQLIQSMIIEGLEKAKILRIAKISEEELDAIASKMKNQA